MHSKSWVGAHAKVIWLNSHSMQRDLDTTWKSDRIAYLCLVGNLDWGHEAILKKDMAKFLCLIRAMCLEIIKLNVYCILRSSAIVLKVIKNITGLYRSYRAKLKELARKCYLLFWEMTWSNFCIMLRSLEWSQ